MANRFYHWVDCKECDGTAKVWHQNPGSKYIDLVQCKHCFAGKVEARMTKEEALKAAENM